MSLFILHIPSLPLSLSLPFWVKYKCAEESEKEEKYGLPPGLQKWKEKKKEKSNKLSWGEKNTFNIYPYTFFLI